MIRQLFKHSSVYFSGLLISKVVTFATYVVLARFLLPQKFGELVFIVTIIQVATVLADFGLNQWYQKQADLEDKTQLFSNIVVARMLTLCISSLILYAILTAFPVIKVQYWLLIAILFPESIISITDGYYLERKKTLRVAFKNASKIGILLLGFFATKDFFSVQLALYFYLLGSLVTALWSFPYKNSFIKPTFNQIINTLKGSMSYAFLNLTSYAYARGDSVILRILRGDTALGLYGSAYRYLESVALIPTALSHNLFPISAQKKGVTIQQLKKIWMLTALAGLVIGSLFFVFSDILIVWLLGTAYATAVPVMHVFSIVVFLFFINSPLNTVVISSDYVTSFTPWGIANTLFNLILNVLLIPQFGIIGAAYAMALTEVTGLLINGYFVKQIYKK